MSSRGSALALSSTWGNNPPRQQRTPLPPPLPFGAGPPVAVPASSATPCPAALCKASARPAAQPLRFSLAFGNDAGYPGFIGNPATYGLMYNVGAVPSAVLAPTVPVALYFTYQLMFAIVTPAIIVGAIAERWVPTVVIIIMSSG